MGRDASEQAPLNLGLFLFEERPFNVSSHEAWEELPDATEPDFKTSVDDTKWRG